MESSNVVFNNKVNTKPYQPPKETFDMIWLPSNNKRYVLQIKHFRMFLIKYEKPEYKQKTLYHHWSIRKYFYRRSKIKVTQ